MAPAIGEHERPAGSLGVGLPVVSGVAVDLQNTGEAGKQRGGVLGAAPRRVRGGDRWWIGAECSAGSARSTGLKPISGRISANERRSLRQSRAKPLIETLKTRLTEQLAKLPRGSQTAKAIHYGLNHWERLGRFLDGQGVASPHA